MKNKNNCKTSFFKNRFGSIAILFALMLPVILGAVGVSLDYAQAYLVQQRLAQALDAAALAGAASSTNADEIQAKVNQFFAANYPPDVLGAEFVPHVEVDGNKVKITGTARYDTIFVNAIGIHNIDVAAHTTVDREIRGLEVAMVLDNTGSMVEEMPSLKEAADNFIDIIFNAALEDDDVKIGMVPYSSTVNLGTYGMGKTPTGAAYDGGTLLVNKPSDVTYSSTASTTNWNGCVVEHKTSGYSTLATEITGTRGQLWKVGSSSTWNGHGYNPAVTNNDPSPNDYTDAYTGPWDVYEYGRVIAQNAKCSDQGSGYATARCSSCSTSGTSKDKCTTSYCFCWYSNVNQYCPAASVMPLTSDRAALHTHVAMMKADGATVPSTAMNWGFRVLSPAAPFREGSQFNDEYWQKAVLFMTDGETAKSGDMTSYWADSKNAVSDTTVNTRLKSTCATLKDKDHNVKIYTVIFGSLDATTRAVYKTCASDGAFYEALNTDQLIAVFEDIARELANLHISE